MVGFKTYEARECCFTFGSSIYIINPAGFYGFPGDWILLVLQLRLFVVIESIVVFGIEHIQLALVGRELYNEIKGFGGGSLVTSVQRKAREDERDTLE